MRERKKGRRMGEREVRVKLGKVYGRWRGKWGNKSSKEEVEWMTRGNREGMMNESKVRRNKEDKTCEIKIMECVR